jgi:hypothetical protein
MIERKKKICKCGCGEEGYIYARGMLRVCDRRENPHKHGLTTKNSPPKKKTASKIVKNYKASGQAALFEALWNTRPRVSFISGIPVTPEPSTFAHLLSKAQNKYPKFKLYSKNIVFLTRYEHFLLDHGTEELREKYVKDMLSNHGIVVDWEKLYTLREILIEEYRTKEK